MMKPPLSHCAQELYSHDRDRFLLCLFIPTAQREAFFCLYALNLELARIPSMISEEMIGHIRYAWWSEAIEEAKPRGQPVLQALAAASVPQALSMKLVTVYREQYPTSLPGDTADVIALELLQLLCPESQKHWHKAQTIIARHRKRYGHRHNSWLSFKLLLA